LGSFGPARNQRQAAVRAEAFGWRQLDGLFPDRQMAIVPALGPGPTRLLAAWPRGLGLAGVVELVGAVPAGLLFRLAPEGLGLELAVFAAEVFALLFEFGEAPAGLGMHALPVPGLLPQFEVLPAQSGHLGTQGRDVLVELRDRRHRRRWVFSVRGRFEEDLHDPLVIVKTRRGWKEKPQSKIERTTVWTKVYAERRLTHFTTRGYAETGWRWAPFRCLLHRHARSSSSPS